MKNFKKVLSLVLALSMILSTMTLSFAAADTTAEKADVLNALGLLNGVSTEEFDPALDVEANRQTAMVLLARAFRWELDEEATTDFEDVADWAVPAVAYAAANGVTNGMSEDEFGALEMVTARQVATWVERLLTGSETAWEDNADLDNEDATTRGDLVDVIWETLSQTPVGAEKSLIETIIGDDADLLAVAQEAGLVEVPVVPAELAVKSVKADNLKVVAVEFNKAVDSTTVTTTTVKLVKGSTDVIAASGLKLSEDKMTLFIELTGVTQSNELKLTVNGVKADSEEIKDYELTFVVADTSIPTVVGASALNAKTVEVFFSEPINFSATTYQVLNDVKIDNVAVIAKATSNIVKNSVVFELPTALAAGEHTIEVSNMVDYATYKAVKAAFAFTVVADTSAPILVSATVKNTSEIEVVFDESLSSVGTIKVNGTPATATVVTDSNNTKYTLSGFGTLTISAVVEIKIAYKDQTDVVGNKVATEATYVTKVTDDTVLPTVTAALATGNKLVLTFSKTMSLTDGSVAVKTKAGTTTVSQPFVFKTGTNNTVLEIPASSIGLNSINPEDVTVTVKGFKDATVRANGLVETVVTLSAVDTMAPTVNDKYLVAAGTTIAEDTITFYFSEAMDTATLNNLSNYVGSTLGALASVTDAKVKSIAADAKSITITVPNANALATALETYSVYALKDVAGNMSVTKTGIAKNVATTLAVVSAEAAKVNEIKVVFDTAISTVDPSALKVVLAAGGADEAVFVNAVLDSTDSTNKTVVFTTNKNLNTDISLYNIKENNVTSMKNIYGSTLTAPGATAITDKVVPTVSVATGENAGEIKVTFSESVDATDIGTLNNDLIVRNKNGVIVPLVIGTNATLSGGSSTLNDFTTIVITGQTTGDTYTVELISRSVVDQATNKVTGLSATSVVVK